MEESITTDPDKFIRVLKQQPEWHSLQTAQQLDALDPLAHTKALFNIDQLIPFAGHSLGPVFQLVLDKINETVELQKQLHKGHFPDGTNGKNIIGNWFDCDRHPESIQAAKALIGFEDDSEFIFTASGLSQNLGMLMDTFYRPGKDDWKAGKNKIVLLSTEFFSDQAEAVSVAERAISTADDFHVFKNQARPDPEDLIIKIPADEKGLYHTDQIIKMIKEHAHEIKLINLSDTVFSTGQRLELAKIFAAIADVIRDNNIIVGIDLAHTVGNRTIDLKSMPITYAVGCGYKHLSGFAGSGFGIYVNQNVDLKKYPSLQGWKAADPSRIFATINHYDKSIMSKTGAVAFRASNPPPIALIPTQVFLCYFNEIGFDKCFNKSECLTRYMLEQLKYQLGDNIEFITPEDPAQRGAMIVFRIKGLSDVNAIEDYLKNEPSTLGNFEVDVRPPNNVRLTAHYAYTSFEQINQMVAKLDLAIKQVLENNCQSTVQCK